MNEMTELWHDYKEHGKEKKYKNKEYSTKLLTDKGLILESHNYGVHLVVKTRNGKADFWPSTGNFIERKTEITGRGVKNLLNRLCDD